MFKNAFLGAVLVLVMSVMAIACPPPKFQAGQLVELQSGVRLFIVSKEAKHDVWHYGLSVVKDNGVVVVLTEDKLKPVK